MQFDHTRDPATMSNDDIRAEIRYLEETTFPAEDQFYMENRFDELCNELISKRNESLR